MKIDFHCSKCGACCSHLSAFNHIYDELDRGDGVCKFFDDKERLCTIYETRPSLCRVVESYKLFADNITQDTYIKQTKEACAFLQTLDV